GLTMHLYTRQHSIQIARAWRKPGAGPREEAPLRLRAQRLRGLADTTTEPPKDSVAVLQPCGTPGNAASGQLPRSTTPTAIPSRRVFFLKRFFSVNEPFDFVFV